MLLFKVFDPGLSRAGHYIVKAVNQFIHSVIVAFGVRPSKAAILVYSLDMLCMYMYAISMKTHTLRIDEATWQIAKKIGKAATVPVGPSAVLSHAIDEYIKKITQANQGVLAKDENNSL